MKSIRNYALIALALVAAGLYASLHHERAKRVEAELSRDSVEAAADSTRKILSDALREHVHAFDRRVVQLRELNDELSESLGREARVVSDLRLRLAMLDTVVIGEPAADVEETARYDFEIRDPPYDVEASVVVDPLPPSLELGITLDTIPLGIRIGCEPRPDSRVSRAYATVTAPEWAEVTVTEARQSAEVCNPDLTDPPSLWDSYGRPAAVGGAVGLGLYLLSQAIP